ncbi:MAG TPA: CTB family bacteriocin [Nostocaceae cyanobacterium]|nr:CTB family bacteriocin [Nostocaceae cyanobacterium]
MSHQLFTELSLEQQEIVSGGGKVIDYIDTEFNQSSESLNVNKSSTAAGDCVSQAYVVNQVNTSASKKFINPPKTRNSHLCSF